MAKTPSNFTVKLYHNDKLLNTEKIKGKIQLGKYLRQFGVPQSEITGYYARIINLPGNIRVEWDYL